MIYIGTERKSVDSFSRQCVYEWEEDFSTSLNFSFKDIDGYQNHSIARLMRKLNIKRPIRWKSGDDIWVAFVMNIDLLRLMTWYLGNILPIMLDVERKDIPELIMFTRNLPVYYVTSYSTYCIIKENYPNSNVRYMPLMVSSRYTEKKEIDCRYDFVQFGRRNEILHKYAIRYCDEHQGRKYVYRHSNPKLGMTVYCNGQNVDIGSVDTRTQFIDMLRCSRISLCSTPAVDGSRGFGEGIDFITPRWYESYACKCSVIGRWTDDANEEVGMTGLNEVTTCVETYEMFEKLANEYLYSEKQNNDKINLFIEKNTATKRSKELIEELRKQGLL